MVFLDTNIFIYAFDEADLIKTAKARELIRNLVATNQLLISTQVMQEFCSATLKKAEIPLKPADVRKIVRELLSPLVAHQPDPAFCLRTLEMYERYSLSFYDAAIVQAANDLSCRILYSEDLQPGTTYGTVKVVNPFL